MALFQETGAVKRVSIAKDGAGLSRGFGHVEFKDAASKEAILKMSRRITLNGNSLNIRKATVGGSKNKRPKGSSGATDTSGKKKKRKRAGKGRYKGSKGEGGDGSNRAPVDSAKKKPRITT